MHNLLVIIYRTRICIGMHTHTRTYTRFTVDVVIFLEIILKLSTDTHKKSRIDQFKSESYRKSNQNRFVFKIRKQLNSFRL